MKKKIGIIIVIILFIIVMLSIPVKYELKDGGTIVYKSILWEYSKVNRIDTNKISKGETFYIFGIKVKDNVKEEKREVKTKKVKDTVKKENETRYYQYVDDVHIQEKDAEGNGLKEYTEIELNADGTAKIGYLRVNDSEDKEGIYTENDKYIILALNSNNPTCYEDSSMPVTADSCSNTIVLIKDGDVLKTQFGFIYHFEIDNVNNSREFLKVEKSELQTALKN
ncbi:MAG: hypothetical protein J6O56_04880 [Bacilli bacterium]|nr:hypothetical protein [Bacilli bacterium]